MPETLSSITLIGMPGAGKSSVGVLAAKRLVRRFVDTDLEIQEYAGRSLQEILDEDGYLALRALEEQVLLSADIDNAVVATGGSAVYSEHAMRRLRSVSRIVYLQVDLTTVLERIGDFSARGIAKPRDQTIAAVFEERRRLYEAWADVTLDAMLPVEVVVARVVDAL